MNGMVRTVLGDVDADQLGVTFMHEHLIIDSDAVRREWPHILLTSIEDASEEVRRCSTAGVGAMVDAMPLASGRGPRQLAEISRKTGVAIVMTTGLHTEKYYAYLPWVEEASAEQLASWFVADITDGVDAYDRLSDKKMPTDHRAGIVKIATSHGGVDARARRDMEAAWITMQSTGVPLLTHCEEGTGAAEQLEALSDVGVPLERVVMSHTDKVDDPAYHSDLLESGVSLEFDQAIRQSSDVEPRSAHLLATQLERGFVGQLMLGTDGARRSLWSVYGHERGLAWMADGYRAVLEALDIDRDMQETMFVSNPARLLAMHKPSAVAEGSITSSTESESRETV